MKLNQHILNIQVIVLAILIASCQSPSGDKEPAEEQDTINTSEPAISEQDRKTINRMIRSINPPLEMTYIINDLNLNFSSSSLSNSASSQMFNNSLDQAVGMGIYGADLVYCLVYKRNDLAMEYLKAVKNLSDALNLSNEIDFEKLERLAEENADPDRLASNFTIQMEHVHDHLTVTNRSELSAMLAFGGWVESIYIASESSEQVEIPTEELTELIYYEADLSNDFLAIFKKFDKLPGHEQMPQDLQKLSEILNQFEKKLTKVEPEVRQSDEMTTVVDLSTQELKYKPEQVAELKDQIRSIRTELLKESQ